VTPLVLDFVLPLDLVVVLVSADMLGQEAVLLDLYLDLIAGEELLYLLIKHLFMMNQLPIADEFITYS